MPREITILHAPSPLGLKPPAEEGRIPASLMIAEAACWGCMTRCRQRSQGLWILRSTKRSATLCGECATPTPSRAIRWGWPTSWRSCCADARFPLILGGDCSIALGVALALRRKGRFGLVYLDAHSDCQTPASSETSGVAGMPLAMITEPADRICSLRSPGSCGRSSLRMTRCWSAMPGPVRCHDNAARVARAGSRIRVHDAGRDPSARRGMRGRRGAAAANDRSSGSPPGCGRPGRCDHARRRLSDPGSCSSPS